MLPQPEQYLLSASMRRSIKPIYDMKYNEVLNGIMSRNTHEKYVVLCKREDCWIDPLKLQKLVDFFEENSKSGKVTSFSV